MTVRIEQLIYVYQMAQLMLVFTTRVILLTRCLFVSVFLEHCF